MNNSTAIQLNFLIIIGLFISYIAVLERYSSF